MHYGINQKFGGPGQDLGGGACAPWPQPKTATVVYQHNNNVWLTAVDEIESERAWETPGLFLSQRL